MDPVAGVHTQNVESFHDKIKKSTKDLSGIDEDKREDFLQEFMLLHQFKNSFFEIIFDLLNINLIE